MNKEQHPAFALIIRKRVMAVVWIFVLAVLVYWQAQDAEEAVDEETKTSQAAATPPARTPAPKALSLHLPYTKKPEKPQAHKSPPRIAKIHNCDSIQDKMLCKLNYVPRQLLEATAANPIKLWAAIAAYDLTSRVFVLRMIRNFAEFSKRNVKVTVQLHTTASHEKWAASTEFVRLSKLVNIELKVHPPRIKYALVRAYRPELVKVIDQYEWFFFSEDDTDFMVEHFELLLSTWGALEYSQHMPGEWYVG